MWQGTEDCLRGKNLSEKKKGKYNKVENNKNERDIERTKGLVLGKKMNEEW